MIVRTESAKVPSAAHLLIMVVMGGKSAFECSRLRTHGSGRFLIASR